MSHTLHFISGLPRSGSTLLAAILRQNPRIHASIASPLASLIRNQINCMSFHESAALISDSQRLSILQATLTAFYSSRPGGEVVFDTSREWTAFIALIGQLVPGARVVCCVRNPAWILDSLERLVQQNPLRASSLFGKLDAGTNVFSRYELLAKSGMLGTSMKCLRQAWFGADARRLIVVRYESLANEPSLVINKLYDLLGLDLFAHDFDRVEYDEMEFDERVNMPGLHRVSGPVKPRLRQTILPPELFNQNRTEFWNERDQNPNNVTVL